MYDSDVELGRKYRDQQTGFEGVATSVTFFQHGCERVSLEAYDAGRKEIKVEIFDSPRLIDIVTDVRASSDIPGGPGAVPTRPGPLSR